MLGREHAHGGLARERSPLETREGQGLEENRVRVPPAYPKPEAHGRPCRLGAQSKAWRLGVRVPARHDACGGRLEGGAPL